MNANGDTYLVKEWDDQVLLAVMDGLGHGAEASAASEKAKEFLVENYSRDIKQIVLDLHTLLSRQSRGIVAGLVRIDGTGKGLSFCGIGNTEVRIVSEPPMHPASLDGVLGSNLRKAVKFEYRYDSLEAVVLYSDGIPSRFDLSDYPLIYEQPQAVAERIIAEWGKSHDDATIIIAVKDEHSIG